MDLHLNSETVQRVPAAEPLCVEPEVSLHEVLRRLKENNSGSLLICREGRLIGIFTERDALKLIAEEADLQAPIGQYMTKDPVHISIADTVGTAIKKMSTGGYRRLPVLDDQGAPVSVIKVSHIMRYLVEHFPEYIYNLPPRPHPALQQREGA